MSETKQFENRQRAESFGSVAANYDRYRPTYPPALIDDLAGTGAQTAFDIGCGTGLLAQSIAARGIDVTGIDPDPEMAAVAARRGLTVEGGRFEDWDPRGRAVDLITFGQSWHWVNPALAAPKVFGLLNPGGNLVLAWNRIQALTPSQAQFEEVMGRHSGKAPHARGRGKAADEVAATLTSAGFTCETRQYDRTTIYSADDYLALLFTYSVQLTLPAGTARAMRTDLENLLGGQDVHADTGCFSMWAHRP
ncbi:class I SAM-dependent methyltransferase [Jongsikchunia kroppenstedtii]|uniref:class I SAM-dependent methyltransferase n=1 Tax=Jongsikchunia kroppenstedtii TaxID=1121721 RepID=UPI000377F362|nr:class I SAM-dependent methyltransferase [Jongsikchunia kroppenstedtii]